MKCLVQKRFPSNELIKQSKVFRIWLDTVPFNTIHVQKDAKIDKKSQSYWENRKFTTNDTKLKK